MCKLQIGAIKRILISACCVMAVAIVAQAQSFQVTETVLKADEGRMSGPCPLKVTFGGYIKTNGPGVVEYTFGRSDGATGPVYKLEFKEAGTQAVSTDWTLGDERVLPAYKGWQAIRILSPNAIESSHETGGFSIDCRAVGNEPRITFGTPGQAKVAGEDSNQGTPGKRADASLGGQTPVQASPKEVSAAKLSIDADQKQPRDYTPSDLKPAPQPQPVVPRLPTSGRFRVTLNAFKVNRQTADNRIEGDGRGDEVFVMADVWELEANGRVPFRRNFRSRVMGDPVNHPERVPAGLAEPGFLDVGGVNGGLITGDVFPYSPWHRGGDPQRERLPMLLWEGELRSGENFAVIIPTVWEWDDQGVSESERQWQRWSRPDLSPDGGLTAPRLFFPASGFDRASQLRRRPLGHVGVAEIGFIEVGADRGGNRPIGLARSWMGEFTEILKVDLKALILSFESATRMSEGEWGVFDRSGRAIPGLVALRYLDGGIHDVGDYTLYLLIERR